MSKLIQDLTFISRCGARYRNRILEPLGLTARQSLSLLQICKEPGISQDMLAQRVALDKSNITRQLTVLEENGLVERRTCQKDKRIFRLHPTEKALELLPNIRSASQSWEQLVTQELSGEKRQILEQALAIMKEKARQWMEVDRLGQTE